MHLVASNHVKTFPSGVVGLLHEMKHTSGVEPTEQLDEANQIFLVVAELRAVVLNPPAELSDVLFLPP